MNRTLLVAIFLVSLASLASGSTDCNFVINGSVMTLTVNCSTDASIVVPDGFTADLGGFTVTAVDPVGDHFRGGVLVSGGSRANVTNGTITASNLATVTSCDDLAHALRGVLFNGASGMITNLKVLNIHRGTPLDGCQEGNGIEASNFGTSPTTLSITIDSNTITGYQNLGIAVNGDAFGIVTNNTVTGAGPLPTIAQYGILIGFGAVGHVKRNTVSGNAYTGPDAALSGGVLVAAGGCYGSGYSFGDQIQSNTVTGNDIGVWLSQIKGDCVSPPATQTNVNVINNTISNAALTNSLPSQAGIVDQGNNDKIINNTISGAGYDPATSPGNTFFIYAPALNGSAPFTTKAHVRANK